MIIDDKLDQVLIEPARGGANHLLIASGYATSAMAFHHLQKLKEAKVSSFINLIIGMCPRDGLSLSNHKAFQKISNEYPELFQCSYVYQGPPVHSKLYVWLNNEKKPVSAYTGSANYTQVGFIRNQKEILVECDPNEAYQYFIDITGDTIFCQHPEVEDLVTIISDIQYANLRNIESTEESDGDSLVSLAESQGLEIRHASFLDNHGDLPQHSGLNWAFRKTAGYNRNKNEAYIRLPANIYKSDFFPPKGVHFTVLTDDNKVLICSRAQKRYGEAVATPHDNSLLGEYFRGRLGVPYGNIITKNDLQKYNRNDVTFIKIDEETYIMDFSV